MATNEGGEVTEHEKWADKVAALLRKAESTTPQEAEALVEKAQELMAKYAIDQALIDEREGRTRDEIEQRVITFAGLFHYEKMQLLSVVGRANNCKGVMDQCTDGCRAPREVDGKLFKHWTSLTLTGYRTDLDRVELLNASLQVQMTSAQLTWWNNNPNRAWLSKNRAYRERRQFLLSFNSALYQRLQAANQRAAAAAREEERSRGGDESRVALVLRNRADTVSDWYDEYYAGGLRTVTRRFTPGSLSAREAGTAAGRRADVGQPGLGARRQLKS